MARLWCRRIRKQALWWDDYLVMFSTVWNWAVVGIGFAMFVEGVGYHADAVGALAVADISKWLLVTEVVYVWNLCWTKLSLLCMYYRIFRLPRFKRHVLCAGAFVVTWAACVSLLFTFICVPVEKLWRPDVEGRCVSELGVWLANAGSTILSDMVILLLPMPQVWKLQLRTLEKLGLTLVFGLGFFAVFASSFRVWVLFHYSKHDVSYTLAPLLAWSDIEMSAGIISACLPTMRPIVRLATAKLALGLSRFTRASADRSVQDPVPPSFVTAESTRRQDRGSVFYRLPDDNCSGCSGRIQVQVQVGTSIEREVESQGNVDTAVVLVPQRNETAYDGSSSIEMDGLSDHVSTSTGTQHIPK
ncbi:hypothetical protein ED733_004934 [Metarhizium rileyi]|uniref:Rhodopsin domain-containing protein n=1 Tax=Metarhizium rileyi (strain RCEF 4871) TaxID=1649241 RepID=A0A5C6GLU4_METRR|nr:hypothetical protein ED733_004934 [Metarhizium rileyi]